MLCDLFHVVYGLLIVIIARSTCTRFFDSSDNLETTYAIIVGGLGGPNSCPPPKIKPRSRPCSNTISARELVSREGRELDGNRPEGSARKRASLLSRKPGPWLKRRLLECSNWLFNINTETRVIQDDQTRRVSNKDEYDSTKY